LLDEFKTDASRSAGDKIDCLCHEGRVGKGGDRSAIRQGKPVEKLKKFRRSPNLGGKAERKIFIFSATNASTNKRTPQPYKVNEKGSCSL
jgi:hypothetical protein